MTTPKATKTSPVDAARATIENVRKDQILNLLFDIRASGATHSVEGPA